MINELPSAISSRVEAVFLNRIARLPYDAIVKLSHTLGRWLEQNLVTILEFDDVLGWAVQI